MTAEQSERKERKTVFPLEGKPIWVCETRHGWLVVNLETRKVKSPLTEEHAKLTKTELCLLTALFEGYGSAVSFEELSSYQRGGVKLYRGTRIIETYHTYVNRIRLKLGETREKRILESVRNIGFIIDKPQQKSTT